MGSPLGISVRSCVGGTAVGGNIKKLKSGGVHVIVGTLGRVGDMISKGRKACVHILSACKKLA